MVAGSSLSFRRDGTEFSSQLLLMACGSPRRSRQLPVYIVAIVDSQADLLEVVLALGAASSLAHLLHSRQQQADEDSNDGDDHQQLQST